jgi:hypothetical protein
LAERERRNLTSGSANPSALGGRAIPSLSCLRVGWGRGGGGAARSAGAEQAGGCRAGLAAGLRGEKAPPQRRAAYMQRGRFKLLVAVRGEVREGPWTPENALDTTNVTPEGRGGDTGPNSAAPGPLASPGRS